MKRLQTQANRFKTNPTTRDITVQELLLWLAEKVPVKGMLNWLLKNLFTKWLVELIESFYREKTKSN